MLNPIVLIPDGTARCAFNGDVTTLDCPLAVTDLRAAGASDRIPDDIRAITDGEILMFALQTTGGYFPAADVAELIVFDQTYRTDHRGPPRLSPTDYLELYEAEAPEAQEYR
jgi:hypothetical protein